MSKNNKQWVGFGLSFTGCLLLMFSPMVKNITFAESSVQKTVSVASVTMAPLMPGDVTLDFKVDMEDAQLALNAALGTVELSDEAIESGDLNHNGSIDLEDAQAILNIALGI